jgi:hypothetical protein
LQEHPGGRDEVVDPPVVPHPLPGLEDILSARRGECRQVGKAPQERLVVPQDRLDASLLEHDLRDPLGIGVAAAAAPGQVPAVAVVPGEECAADATSRTGRDERIRPVTGSFRAVGA